MADGGSRVDYQASAAIDVTCLRGLPQIDKADRQIDRIIFKTAAIAGDRDLLAAEDVASAEFVRLSRRFRLGLNTSELSFLQMRGAVIYRLVVAAQREHPITVNDSNKFGQAIASVVAHNSLGVWEIKRLVDHLFTALEKVQGRYNHLGLMIFTTVWVNAYRLAQVHRDWCAAGGHALTDDPQGTERMVQDFLARLEDGSVTVGMLDGEEKKYVLARYDYDHNTVLFLPEYLGQLTYQSIDPILLIGQQVFSVEQDARLADVYTIAGDLEGEIFGLGALRLLHGNQGTQAFLAGKVAERREDWQDKADQGRESVTGIFYRDYLAPGNQAAQRGISWRLEGLALAEERLTTGQIAAGRQNRLIEDYARYRLLHEQVGLVEKVEADYKRDPAAFKAHWRLLDGPTPEAEILASPAAAQGFRYLVAIILPRMLGWMVALYHEHGARAAEGFYHDHYVPFFERALLPGMLALHSRSDGFSPRPVGPK